MGFQRNNNLLRYFKLNNANILLWKESFVIFVSYTDTFLFLFILIVFVWLIYLIFILIPISQELILWHWNRCVVKHEWQRHRKPLSGVPHVLLGTGCSHYFKLLKRFHRFPILPCFGTKQTKRKTLSDENGKMNNPVEHSSHYFVCSLESGKSKGPFNNFNFRNTLNTLRKPSVNSVSFRSPLNYKF